MAATTTRDRKARAPVTTLGTPTATALVMGSIIGVGIFNLPTAFAGYGPISLVAMAITTVGAAALAVMFAVLTRRLPAAGGPYAYSRSAFGNGVGFLNAWSYWITAWAGNAAIVVGWVLYVQYFINKDAVTGWSIVIALIGLWIPAGVNLLGVSSMGTFQVWSTVLKFVPLLLMSTVGLFFISSENFSNWNVSGDSNLSAIGSAMAIALFSYLGVETAAVAAGKVRDPDRNVGRATVLGTLASAVVYLLSLIAVFGILGTGALSDTTAPYSDAAREIAGGGWAADLMAVAVIISGIGALNGWTMICAEMPLAAARDGLFPQQFARLSDRQVPAFGIISSTLLASVAMVIAYLGNNGATVFTTLVLMSGITAAIPYAFSALAQLRWRWNDRNSVNRVASAGPGLIRDLLVAGLSLVFSLAFIYYSRNSGDSWLVVWGPFLMAGGALALGVPVYLAQRARMGAPTAVGEYR